MWRLKDQKQVQVSGYSICVFKKGQTVLLSYLSRGHKCFISIFNSKFNCIGLHSKSNRAFDIKI